MSAMDEARKITPPEGGVVVTVPLRCWPEYMKLHGIEPYEYVHPIVMVRRVEGPSSALPSGAPLPLRAYVRTT